MTEDMQVSIAEAKLQSNSPQARFFIQAVDNAVLLEAPKQAPEDKLAHQTSAKQGRHSS